VLEAADSPTSRTYFPTAASGSSDLRTASAATGFRPARRVASDHIPFAIQALSVFQKSAPSAVARGTPE
jgi:hypothetical protein